jgi:hypothetical protein
LAVLPLKRLVARLRERSGVGRMPASVRWVRLMRSRGWGLGSLVVRLWLPTEAYPDWPGAVEDVVTVTLESAASD